jgi:endonuclease YncB( thermonuclease family)
LAGARGPREIYMARVVAVADGDTVTVLKGLAQIKVRLWGIDCPEKRQAFGDRAKRFTGDLAFGKVVTVAAYNGDRYGRTVAEITLPDGRNLNRELVRAGLAWWYQRYAPRARDYSDLEAEARAARRGLWADPAPVAPWDFRRARRSSTGAASAAYPPR